MNVAANGDQANNYSFLEGIGANGRYVTFTTHASNLVPGDTNGTFDTFVADLQAGTVRRASVHDTGAEAPFGSSFGPVTNDGAVAFASVSALVANDTNGKADVFVNVPNLALDCSGLGLSPTSLWPTNQKFVEIAAAGATDADGDALTLEYAVTQDEPTGGEPDARVVDGKLELRAERDGSGDGRVYSVTVTARDGQATCSATGTVGVPHSSKANAMPTPGASFDSFGS